MWLHSSTARLYLPESQHAMGIALVQLLWQYKKQTLGGDGASNIHTLYIHENLLHPPSFENLLAVKYVRIIKILQIL